MADKTIHESRSLRQARRSGLLAPTGQYVDLSRNKVRANYSLKSIFHCLGSIARKISIVKQKFDKSSQRESFYRNIFFT